MNQLTSMMRYNFINVPANTSRILNDTIKVTARGETIHITINTASRIVSKKLFSILNPESGDLFILEQNPDKSYVVKIQKK